MVVTYFYRVIVFVAINTAKGSKIAGYRMAFNALDPFTLMLATVNWEILVIVIPSGRHPGCLGVAILTSRRELCRRVIGVVSVVVIVCVATKAGVGSIVVIAVVAKHTVVLNGSMRPVQRPVTVVNRECGRGPVGVGSVAHIAIRGQPQRYVIRVSCLVVIDHVTSLACIGGVVVVPVVTGITIVGNDEVRSSQRVEIIVVKSGRHPSGFSVAFLAISRELVGEVIRIVRLVVVVCVAAVTSVRRIVVVPIVTDGTIVLNGSMGAAQHIVIVVNGEGSRVPIRYCGMAHVAICRYSQCHVIGVGGLVVIGDVAALAGVRRVVVIAVVANRTIVGYG